MRLHFRHLHVFAALAAMLVSSSACAGEFDKLLGRWDVLIDGGGEIYNAVLELEQGDEGQVTGEYEADGRKGRVESVRREKGYWVVEVATRRSGMIEAGVRFVSLTYGAWDTHTYHFRTTRRILPPLDQALAALVGDLDERGMLERTMVIVCSEFGRTPMVNAGAGRDHWPRVFSVLMAGGGLKRGYVHGASDALAAEPAHSPVSPEDLAATIYRQLGVDFTKELMAPGERPLDIVDGGSPISEILA